MPDLRGIHLRGKRYLAIQNGEEIYFTGKPCKHGHISERRVNGSACIECSRIRANSRYSKNPTAMKAYNKEWRKKNPEQWRKIDRKYNGIPEPTRARPEMCECCGKPPQKRALAVDHNHVSGDFRGWLCGRCNTAIGMLGDNIPGVMRAVSYLEKHP